MDSFERDLQASMQRSMPSWGYVRQQSGGAQNDTRSMSSHSAAGDPPLAEPAVEDAASVPESRDASPDETRMAIRTAAYNKMIADGGRILVNGPDGIALPPNPLTVRAWLFNMGIAFDKVSLVMKELDALDCGRRNEKVEKVLRMFRSNGIFDLVVKAIQLRLSYDGERAKEQAERLIRYAYGHSI
jgi:hypothetical protein